MKSHKFFSIITFSVMLLAIAITFVSCSKDDDESAKTITFSASSQNYTWKKSYWEYTIKVSVLGIDAKKVYSIGVAFDEQESKLNVPGSCNRASIRDGVTDATFEIPVDASTTVYYKPFVTTTDGQIYYSSFNLTSKAKP